MGRKRGPRKARADHSQNHEPRFILDIPTEIWHAITEHITDLADLAALARVCKRLHSIVVPHHLNYRAVATYIDDSSFFHELSSNPRKAQTIRKLVLLDRLPLAGATYRQFEMEHLARCTVKERCRSCRWADRELDPPDKLYHREMPGTSDPYNMVCKTGGWVKPLVRAATGMSRLQSLSLCLLTCQFEYLENFARNVAHVEMLDIHIFRCWDHHSQLEMRPAQLKSCTAVLQQLKGGYRKFSWSSMLCESDTRALLDSCMPTIAKQCPELEELKIVVELYDVTHGTLLCASLWGAEWPKLRTLDLNGITITWNGFPVLCQNTPNVENLRVVGLASDEPDGMDNDLLRRLRKVETDDERGALMKSMFEPLDNGAYRPIESLTYVMRNDEDDDAFGMLDTMEDFCFHAGRAGVLRELTWTQGEFPGHSRREERFLPWLKMIGQCVPSIRSLTVRPSRRHGRWNEWLVTLSRFENLEVLRRIDDGTFLSSFEREGWKYDDTMADKLLAELEEECPNLQQVDEWTKVVEEGSPQRWRKGPAKSVGNGVVG